MLRLVLIIAIVVVAAAMFRASRTDRRIAAAHDPTADLEADREALRELRDAGVDLTKATEMNFYLYFPSQPVAERAAARIATPELSARVRKAADGSAWLCLVSGMMVPTETAIHQMNARLQAIAAAHGGEYDGWEAAVAHQSHPRPRT